MKLSWLSILVGLYSFMNHAGCIHPPYGWTQTSLRHRRYQEDFGNNRVPTPHRLPPHSEGTLLCQLCITQVNALGPLGGRNRVLGSLESFFGNLFPGGFFPGIGGGGNSGGGNKARPHPLDPLTETEINSTTRIIKSHQNARSGDFMFNYISLKEPPKSFLIQSFLKDTNPPTNIPRRSITILLDRSTNQAYEVTVNLDSGKVESWNSAPTGVDPSLTPEELLLSENIVREDGRVQERCRKLGWSNMSLVNADPWSMGYVGDRPDYKGKRLCQLYLYGKNFEEDNHYTHPFDFLVVVDLLAKKVIDIEELPTHSDFNAENKEGNNVPTAESNYDPALRDSKSFRKDLKPVRVTQQGTSFSLSGNELKWQKYKMRVGFNGREGLVLYNLNYNDSGTVRPLFYRMSLAEMFIPYGDPRSPYHRKHVFDEGQYGVGFNTNSLRPHIDCVGETKFVDAVLHNEKGEAQKMNRVVCIREVDDGILWKHTDYRTGKNSIVRNQRLVMTFIATVGNYDYIYNWKFAMDGTIEFNVQLTGILSVNLLATDSNPGGHGSVVFPQINAQYHQHFFSLRLDAEIDGNQNSVIVSDVVAGPGLTGSEQNPYGQGWTTEKTNLNTAADARTNVNPEKSRIWLISNPGSKNPYSKTPVAWKLMPFPSPPMLLQKSSPIHPQAAWMDFNTWVTPYQEDQLFPGGYYLNNSGLPEWVEKNPNSNVADTDIVLWHNFGLSHVPRAEDFPVMPHEECSIFLKPYNFFKENPALDVPPPKRRYSTEL